MIDVIHKAAQRYVESSDILEADDQNYDHDQISYLRKKRENYIFVMIDIGCLSLFFEEVDKIRLDRFLKGE